MLYPEIKELHKYYPPEENRIESVLKRTLYLASPRSFNDPFDGKLNVVSDVDPMRYAPVYIRNNNIDVNRYGGTDQFVEKELTSPEGKIRQDILDEYRKSGEFWNTLFDKCGVLSLTTEYDNVLMWSHYAARHSGFCVAYRCVGMLAHDRKCFPAAYSRFFPTVHVADFLLAGEFFRQKFGNKSLDWAYENEWRLVDTMVGLKKDMEFEVSKIYFGLNSDDALIERFKDYSKENKIKLFKAEFQRNEYRLQFGKVTF